MLQYCQNCGEEIHVNRYKQNFCSSRCFKQNYINKQKGNNFPKFICSECGSIIALSFDPRKEKDRWKEFVCPNCGVEKNNKEIIN